MLPIMLSVVEHFPDYEFVIAGVSFLPKEMYENIILNKPVKIVFGKTYPLLYNSYAAIVTSGTATLETPKRNFTIGTNATRIIRSFVATCTTV